MAEIRLKPCPFCGGEAALINTMAFGKSCKSVRCIKCKATVKNFAGNMQEERAVEAWNRRTPNNSTPVVLCKDCKYYSKMYKLCSCRSDRFNVYLNDNDFCSFGERR